MDREEARYRKDGTEEDDHLGDCAKMRCGQASRKPKRKRANSVGSDSDEDIPISALEPRERHGRRKSEAGRKSLVELLTDEDIDMEDATPEKKKNAKPKAAPKKKKSEAAEETKDDREPSVASAVPKAKAKAPRAKKGAEESGTEVTPAAGTKKATKKRKTSD